MRASFELLLLRQTGNLINWVPFCLAIGIGIYFGLGEEPEAHHQLGLVGLLLVCVLLWRMLPPAFAPIFFGASLIIGGFGVAKWRAVSVQEPVLSFRYYGPIEGRVVNIDRSASDAPRLTLDRVRLSGVAPAKTPERVRVSIHGDQVLSHFQPGVTLIMTGHLSPPAGPAEPGGFDFQRHAWFQKLGAVGYTRTSVLRLEPPNQGGIALQIFKLRMQLSEAVQTSMGGETGAVAAAIMTGDRSAMAQSTLDDLRASNLAHLLAISGLHMGLLTGFVFAAIRSGLALWALPVLYWNTKKIAAVGALACGAFYLALSGGNVATERAFIMVAVMLVAILLDRRALTLRAVAIAATIILLWQPEALTSPGFQMSFAATTALVAVFGWLRRFDLYQLPKWLQNVASLFISSAVAGLATAPFAAAHFNQISHYGLIANLVSVPLMGALVMPAAVLAICLAPLGLWHLGLWVMELGLRWILFVAAMVSSWDGALSYVIAPQWYVLPVLTSGFLFWVLWQGNLRHAGPSLAACALLFWFNAERPNILVADNGSLIGVVGAQGRALSKETGSSFVASIWLENDGAPVAQTIAAKRPGYDREGRVVYASVGNFRLVQVSGKTALAKLQGCGGADVLISNQVIEDAYPCAVFDVVKLRETGSLAISLRDDGALKIVSARAIAGNRLWNSDEGAVQTPIILPAQ